VGRAGPNNWARHKPRKQWADIGPKQLSQSRPRIFFFFFLGQARPSQLGWARIGPAQLQMNYLQNVNRKFMFCKQLCSCRRRSEMGGNLVGEKELLSLAWREVGGGAGRRNGGGVGCLWRKKKKQKKKICRGEREDLTVAAPITGEDLGSWGGWDAFYWWRRSRWWL